MDEFIKLLDENLEYINHEIIADTIFINVESNREEAICLYCGTPSSKLHSLYERSFQDLPMQEKKVRVILKNSVADVGKSTICNLIKKNTNYR